MLHINYNIVHNTVFKLYVVLCYVLYSTVAILCYMDDYTVQYEIVLHSIVTYCMVLYNIVLYSVLHSKGLNCRWATAGNAGEPEQDSQSAVTGRGQALSPGRSTCNGCSNLRVNCMPGQARHCDRCRADWTGIGHLSQWLASS